LGRDRVAALRRFAHRFAGGDAGDARWRHRSLPDRFVVGSDTWVNARWSSYAEIMAEYRLWLAQLPADVAMKIAYGNGERMFGKLPR
jgi:hypothetical protein